MNRKMLLILCTALIGAGAAGCSGGDTSDAAVNSGTYVIDSDAAEGSFLPSITLDETEQSFHIVYDQMCIRDRPDAVNNIAAAVIA